MPFISGSGGSGVISGVVVSGTAAASQVPVASSSSAGAWGYPPGFLIGRDTITTNVSVASTTEATGTTIISAAAHTFDGTLVRVEFFSYFSVTGTTAGSDVIVSLFESTTQIARLAAIQTSGVSIMGAPLHGVYYFTPTAASHTYTVTAFTTNTTGGPQINAGNSNPAPPAYIAFFKA